MPKVGGASPRLDRLDIMDHQEPYINACEVTRASAFALMTGASRLTLCEEYALVSWVAATGR